MTGILPPAALGQAWLDISTANHHDDTELRNAAITRISDHIAAQAVRIADLEREQRELVEKNAAATELAEAYDVWREDRSEIERGIRLSVARLNYRRAKARAAR